tara:strand:- start:327 stop:857 length:531 start_codon:yes stop_codon:yes gene_type:complete
MSNNLFVEGSVIKRVVPNIANFEFEYPYVYITFNSKQITDDINLEVFFNIWLSIYDENKPYILVFDGTYIDYAKPTFIYKFARFMKKLRAKEPQYLQYSIIIVDNSLMRGLMNMVFRIQKPIAPVYMCKSADELINLHNEIHKNTASKVLVEDKNDVSEEEIRKIYFDNNYKDEVV